jgi:predicted transposase YbfD/YdcC
MISAWATEQELVLGQMSVEEKTNEIPTVPLLLELLDISGCIVTADAMSCQREITKKIMDGKGEYVLSLKENQPTLYEYAETYFKDALEHPERYPEMTTYETVDKGHGRIEKRTYYLSSDLSGLDNVADWSGLAGLGMVRSHVIAGEVEYSEIRYAITSLKSVDTFAHAWRKHWEIENGLHYCLDVSFNEDHSRIRKDHAPENLAVVRHFALSALKQLPQPKRASIKRKRKICAYDLVFLSSAVDLILL